MNDHLQVWGSWSLSITAILVLLGLIYRRAVRPVWRTLRRINDALDRLPGFIEELRSLKEWTEEHEKWHHPEQRGNGDRPNRDAASHSPRRRT